AQTLHNQIRGLIPWPATSMELSGEMVKVFGSTLPEGSTEKEVGTILSANKNGIDIACAEGTILRITELQAQGKRRMSADDYLRGNPIQTEM
ncbi:MAG: methionyl-tRNA formyltransferase, partial [Eubacteriales bacterium]